MTRTLNELVARAPAAFARLLFLAYFSAAVFAQDRPGETRTGHDGHVPLSSAVLRRLGDSDTEKADNITVAFSPDGRRLTVGSSFKDVAVFDVETGALAMMLPVEPRQGRHISQIRVSPSGKFIVARANNGLHFWDARTGKRLLHDENFKPTEFNFLPDESALVAASRSATGCKILVVETKTSRILTSHEFPMTPHSASLSADGRTFFVGAVAWDTSTLGEHKVGVYVCPLDNPANSRLVPGKHLPRIVCAHSHDNVVAVAYNGVSKVGIAEIMDTKVGRHLHGLSVPRVENLDAMAYSPDGKLLVATSNEQLFLWENATGQEIYRGAAESKLTSVAFSPDGTFLAAGGRDGTVTLFSWLKLLGAPHSQKAPRPTAGELLDRLGSSEARIAYAALVELVQRPDDAVALWHDQLDPGDGQQIRTWVHELDDDDFRVRGNAQRRLEAEAWACREFLEDTKAKPASYEQATRLSQLLPFADSKEAQVKRARILRAVHLLELVRTEQARSLLASLAKGDSVVLAPREAAAALGRIAKSASIVVPSGKDRP